MFKTPRWRVFFILLLALALLFTTIRQIHVWRGSDEIASSKIEKRDVSGSNSSNLSATPDPHIAVGDLPTPPPPPSSVSPTSIPQQDLSSPPPDKATAGFVGRLNLIVPVAGVRAEQLVDTFADSRSEGRVHDAIDIPAPAGTPVLAATDGEIVKLFQSERGGTTIYQLSADRKLIYYYAHLQKYADELAEGNRVQQGQIIGFVGDTGNAGSGNYHLHFSIAIVTDPGRYWEGTSINPYPLLRRQ